MKPYGIIYMARNIVNGKVYIGQTRLSLKGKIKEYRGKQCGKINKKYRYFINVLKKYKVDGFEWSMIASAISDTDLNDKEIYWIDFCNSTDREMGYNISPGGDGHACNPETKKKISETLKEGYAEGRIVAAHPFVKGHPSPNRGKKHTAERCARQSQLLKEGYKTGRIKNANKGKTPSPETIAKAKQTKLERYGAYGKVNSGSIKKGDHLGISTEFKPKRVLCVELNKEYLSIKQAANEFGCTGSSITSCLRGKSKTCMGYHWQYIHPIDQSAIPPAPFAAPELEHETVPIQL